MYDENLAARALHFFTSYLIHTTGQWYGQNFRMLDWQEEIVRKVFGTIRPDGTRQYRKVFVFIPKKNGKSEFASGFALYGLCADREPGAQVYSSAGDRDQASIVFNTAVKMIKMNRSLRRLCKIRESTRRVDVLKTMSTYKVLSSEVPTKHGLNPHFSVIDEVHVVRRELFEVLTQGAGAARRQPLTLMITTAGNDKNSLCYEEYTYAKKVRDGLVKDESYLPVIYEVPENMDWKTEEAWKAANPSLGKTILIDGLRDDFRMATERPSLVNSFRQLRLNQWVSSRSKWLAVERWDEAREKIDWSEFEGDCCYAGLDLSSTTDITSFKALFRKEVDGAYFYYLYMRFFCPEENLALRSRRDKVPYELWARQGWITPTPGDSVDQNYIKREIVEFNARFDLNQLNFDRWNSSKLVTELQEEGVNVAAFGQGYKSLSTPSKEFEVQVLKKRIRHDGNPVMRWMVDNVIVETDPAGNIKPNKKQSSEKIDGVVATIMALDGWIREPKKSVYEERGIRKI